MKLFVKNIRHLAGVEYEPKLRLQGKEMANVNIIDDAWLLVEDGRFSQFEASFMRCITRSIFSSSSRFSP